ncbi:MAG: hypothetical protein R3E82_16150 [Pseudomonadales bacterium]|nr:hypothetical protein [Pseudomonadales bacterium]
MQSRKATSPLVCVCSFTLMLLLAISSPAAIGQDKDTAPPDPLEGYKARIVFYGDNTRFVGLLGGAWRPKLNINGRNVTTPYGVNVTFYMDVEPGPIEIRSPTDLKLTAIAIPGEPLYVRMEPRKDLSARQTYTLDLTEIDSTTGKRIADRFKFKGAAQWAD